MDKYFVTPGSKVRLADYNTRDTNGIDRASADGIIAADLNAITALQELLYVAGAHSVLIVLQGMDTSGKDGAIRHVFSAVNPAGSKVVSFKVPTEEELAHDYLWRIHSHTPRRGQITIFNRSHYESVLVERVKNLVPREVWSKRFDQINAFEELLASEGTIVMKFFLHISKDEQLERLNARLQDPVKRWKVNNGDWEDRAIWDAYWEAYEEAIEKTSTKQAPWIIVPADRKWMRNLVIASCLRDKLEPFRSHWQDTILNLGEKQISSLRLNPDIMKEILSVSAKSKTGNKNGK